MCLVTATITSGMHQKQQRVTQYYDCFIEKPAYINNRQQGIVFVYLIPFSFTLHSFAQVLIDLQRKYHNRSAQNLQRSLFYNGVYRRRLLYGLGARGCPITEQLNIKHLKELFNMQMDGTPCISTNITEQKLVKRQIVAVPFVYNEAITVRKTQSH